jgi:hypothetical protein
MRKSLPYALAAFAAIAAVLPATAADHPQKPGKWQTKVQMEMPGMPFKMPPVTVDVCLTEEDLNNPEKVVPRDAKQKCTIGDYKVDGSKVSWTMDCPDQNMKGRGEITYTDDSYTGAMKMTMGEQEMNMKYSGKWLGACTKK